MLHMSTTVPMKQFMVCSLLILLVIAVTCYIHFVKEALRSGMALGFFILGPGTHISDQIGVPSIFCGSQSSPQKIALEKKSSK